MHGMSKILYSLARNMFNRSDMDYFMTDVTSEGVNEYAWNV
jgi:hypothetical protein